MIKKNPIGIFDSGVGGASIWKEIQEVLPNEDTIYLADSKNAPYGEKPAAQILQLSIKNTQLLLDKGCKIIVVACNTATTNAIEQLRKKYQVPFIGIEPAIKPAALLSKLKTVGILATKGTLSSSLFQSTSDNYAKGIKLIEREGVGLVPLIEQGKIDSEEIRNLLRTYLEPMLDDGIDYLVLGCTHYSYLTPVLKELLPENVQIIDSGQAVARQTQAVLVQNNLVDPSQNLGRHWFYINADSNVLNGLLVDSDAQYSVEQLDF